MQLTFYKYHGTGNDFIMVDNRNGQFPKNDFKLISSLCERHTGIGADGLILLEEDPESDFKMVYFNADGQEGTMCGNGGRCVVAFARKLGLIDQNTIFSATDGLHEADIVGDEVRLKMQDIETIREKPDYLFLDTGSPHHVQIVNDLQTFDVEKEGRRLRYGLYGKSGSNINFVEVTDDNSFAVRTYERGVENETLSCGTGVTAVALSMHHLGNTRAREVVVATPGGQLVVSFGHKNGRYIDIFLKGPVKEVYKGQMEW
ncbi:MAG: diaminopimelate epimerase [Flavobacteriaceae bacterium]